MNITFFTFRLIFVQTFLAYMLLLIHAQGALGRESQVASYPISSEFLANNLINADSEREVQVLLPLGYREQESGFIFPSPLHI